MRVLIVGISGRLGRLVAAELLSQGNEIVGIDSSGGEALPDGVEVIEAELLKRSSDDLFRTRRFDGLIYLSTPTHLDGSSSERTAQNLLRIKKVLEACHRYEIRRVVFVARHTYYGATAETALYLGEEEPPLGLGLYPELADIVAADLYASSALWRYPEIQTVVLRICFTLGPSAGGTLASYLGAARVPTVMGFDPLIQFMHEADAARAVAQAFMLSLRGVYNVSGPSPIPLSVLLRDSGRLGIPVPEPLFRLALGRFGFPALPEGVVAFAKYPIVIDSSAFRRRAEYSHRFDEHATLRDFVQASPVGLD